MKLNPLKVLFNGQEKKALKEIIEQKNFCSLTITEQSNSIWYRDDEFETELRILFLGNIKLTISRVTFKYRRSGTMTDVLSFLERFCRDKDIKKIVVQSIQTSEMISFCKKNRFVPIASNCIQGDDGEVYGDYEKVIEEA